MMTGITEQRKSLDKYLAQFPANRVTEFECPHCQTRIGALKPETRQYDSMASCPDCAGNFFYVTKPDGTVHTFTGHQ